VIKCIYILLGIESIKDSIWELLGNFIIKLIFEVMYVYIPKESSNKHTLPNLFFRLLLRVKKVIFYE